MDQRIIENMTRRCRKEFIYNPVSSDDGQNAKELWKYYIIKDEIFHADEGNLKILE